MLDTLERYTYLYDDSESERQQIAIAYNNRCYPEMQLKRLHKALADCSKSREYGNLPHVYARQQKRIERLTNRN